MDGTVTIDGIMDQVAPVTEEELAKYPDMDFDVESYKNVTGAPSVFCSNKKFCLLLAAPVFAERERDRLTAAD